MMWQAVPRGNLQRTLCNVIAEVLQQARSGLKISPVSSALRTALLIPPFCWLPREGLPPFFYVIFAAEECLNKPSHQVPQPPTSSFHAFHKNLEFPDALRSCCSILFQDERTNSNLRQIKESLCIDASFQIPSAIVQVF